MTTFSEAVRLSPTLKRVRVVDPVSDVVIIAAVTGKRWGNPHRITAEDFGCTPNSFVVRGHRCDVFAFIWSSGDPRLQERLARSYQFVYDAEVALVVNPETGEFFGPMFETWNFNPNLFLRTGEFRPAKWGDSAVIDYS